MGVFDMIIAPADNYWKKQYNAEKIRRQRAEADAKCYKDEADYNHESLALLSDRDLKQARAIEAYNKEIAALKQELDAKERAIADKDREIVLLHEALRSERDLSAALRTNSRLWESIKQQAREGTA